MTYNSNLQLINHSKFPSLHNCS